MAAVLGIDAAWTKHNPSGVALVAREGAGWRVVAVRPSYESFLSLAGLSMPGDLNSLGGSLVEACGILLGSESLDVVAIDMPMATVSITGRRASDSAISRAFGAAGCSTHSPSAARPGGISDQLRNSLNQAGFPLATSLRTIPSAIEVYPHPAILTLLKIEQRHPYKVSRSRRYWPSLSPKERRVRLVSCLDQLQQALEQELGVLDLPSVVPTSATATIKSWEDSLDALVCAWVATKYMEGHCKPYGNEESAIWVPTAGTSSGFRSEAMS